jgi:hypothetical protein
VVAAPPPPPPPVVAEPDADALVVKKSPDTNFGDAATLEADDSPQIESFLRFTVAGVTGPVGRARLRLYATNPTGNGPALYRTDPGLAWTEAGITWNTRPARSGGAVDNIGKVSSGRYIEYDVTGAVPGDGTYTFNLVAEASDGADFNSREAAANRPQLVVETGTPAPPGAATFGPDADAKVVKGSPNTNFGAATALEADSSPATESFLRFTVAGVTGTVTRARLRLYATDSTSNGPALYRSDPNTAWTEGGITWNTRPDRAGGAVANLGKISSGRYIEYDVTGAVAGNGTYTFNLVPEASDGTDFRSREASSNRPELVVETG